VHPDILLDRVGGRRARPDLSVRHGLVLPVT
jgi:hypothetical protein